jgi:hypothetical protein
MNSNYIDDRNIWLVYRYSWRSGNASHFFLMIFSPDSVVQDNVLACCLLVKLLAVVSAAMPSVKIDRSCVYGYNAFCKNWSQLCVWLQCLLWKLIAAVCMVTMPSGKIDRRCVYGYNPFWKNCSQLCVWLQSLGPSVKIDRGSVYGLL